MEKSERDEQLACNCYENRKTGEVWCGSPHQYRHVVAAATYLDKDFLQRNRLVYRVRITHCKFPPPGASFDPEGKYMT